MDLLDLFERGSAWTASKVGAACDQPDGATPCTDWKVRDLLNHLIDSQRYFAETARAREAPLPNPNPPALIGKDPVAAYENMRQDTLAAHREPGVLEKTGPSLGIAFVDQLVHGWDLATATGQDATMPEDLAEAAFTMIAGRLTDEQRGQGFAEVVDLPPSATIQEKLLAYTGRTP